MYVNGIVEKFSNYRYFNRGEAVIYHILSQVEWAKAQTAGVYEPESLHTEGFIHCSTIDQVTRSANTFFNGQTDLSILWIASEKVQAEIRYEDLAGEGMRFPHIYGPLNLDALVNVSSFEKDNNGKFVFPAG